MQTIFFDIETEALPEPELVALMPPFDPAEVKTGNLKDPDKVAAKVAEAEANHRREFIERAALDPLTGRVLAIGVLKCRPLAEPLHFPAGTMAGIDGEFEMIADDDEARMLRQFWSVCKSGSGRINQMAGFNVHTFDLPFLFRRSWKHRVPVPLGLRRGRYWNEQLVDLRESWQLGDRQARGSLEAIAKHLGVGVKTGDGRDFAKLWRHDRAKAVEYLQNDLELTACIADVLGCCA